MKLKSLTLENIRSYKKHEVKFPEGSILLSGDIGSGKTSILLAIEFALFGLQPGQRGTSLLRNGEDNGNVSLEFESEGNLIKVERSLRKGTKSVTQDYSSITINGEKQEISTMELKTKILSILNYPPEFIKKTNLLFRYTVYSPQEGMKHIITEDPELRLNILRHVFGIDKYKRIKENIQIIHSKLKEEIRFFQIRILDLDTLRIEIEKNNLRESEINSLLIEKQSELEKKNSLTNKLSSEIAELEEKIEEKRKFESELEKTLIMKSNKKYQLLEISRELSDPEFRNLENQESFDKFKLQSVLEMIEKKREKLTELNNAQIALQSSINSIHLRKKDEFEKRSRVFKIDLCPTCLQNVPESHKHNILHDTDVSLAKAEKEIKKGEEELVKLRELIENETKYLDELYSEKSKLKILESKEGEKAHRKQRLENLNKTLLSLNKDIDFLEKHIKLLRDSVSEFSRFDTLFKAKREEIYKAQLQERNSEIEIAELKKERELLANQLSALKNKIKEKELEAQRLSDLTELEQWISKDFTELISFTERNIMFKLRQEFSKLFNKWFEMLVTDNLYVHLDENFTPIITQGDFEIDYAFLSGGERTAVALAYRLALNQTINSIFSKIRTKNLVILDEPTDGFSDQQLDKVREVLQELKLEQLIIVSHEQKVESFVENIIRLKKDSQVSKAV